MITYHDIWSKGNKISCICCMLHFIEIPVMFALLLLDGRNEFSICSFRITVFSLKIYPEVSSAYTVSVLLCSTCAGVAIYDETRADPRP
jgi:hypothetical protein